jgi:hypothetical protein
MGLTNVEFEVKDVEACKLSGTYDAIVETLCLKYVKDIGAVLRHLSSLLEPQGILVTSTLRTIHPNDLNPLLRSAGLSYLGQPFGHVLLVARKQAAGCAPEEGGPLSLLVRPGRMPGHLGRCLISIA